MNSTYWYIDISAGGSTDPKMNAKLAQVMESAKKSSLSPDTIKKLIERMVNFDYKFEFSN